jgi:broad specificity phosphatase PhoE
MTLWFETHATSLDNEAQLASGWFDVALSPLGELQARELGERRRGLGLTAVYCSDLRRSYETAEIAFAGTGVPIVRDARLRECDYGAMTRQPTAVVEARRLDAIEIPFRDGESYLAATARVAAWLRDAKDQHPTDTILLIGHRATFYALEHLCRGRQLEEVIAAPWKWQPGWRYDMSPAR